MRKATYLFLLFCIGAGCIGTATIHAQAAKKPTPAESILCLVKGEDAVDIVDPVSFTVVARMYAGGRPHELVASTDGKTAYIGDESPKNNIGGRFGFSSYVSRETISVVDLVNQEELPPIDLGPLRVPHGVTYADGKVYFGAQQARALGRYNTETKTVDWVMGVPGSPHMVAVTKDGKIIGLGGGGVDIVRLDVRKGSGVKPDNFNPNGASANPWLDSQTWHITSIPGGSEAFDISPDGRQLITGDKDNLLVIDLASEKVVNTVHIDNASGPNRIKYTLDGKYILESFLGRPEVVVLDAATYKEFKRIPTSGHTEGLLMNPDGKKAYVTEDTAGLLGEIDLKTWTVTRELKVGEDPDGLAWASRQ